MTMNTANMMSYVAASPSAAAFSSHAEVNGKDNEVEDNGSEHEDSIRATALAELANYVVVDLTEHFDPFIGRLEMSNDLSSRLPFPKPLFLLH